MLALLSRRLRSFEALHFRRKEVLGHRKLRMGLTGKIQDPIILCDEHAHLFLCLIPLVPVKVAWEALVGGGGSEMGSPPFAPDLLLFMIAARAQSLCARLNLLLHGPIHVNALVSAWHPATYHKGRREHGVHKGELDSAQGIKTKCMGYG